jgi:diguanylate cyclase (GGDEF)-like protein/PAS domain S-box-containing protein
MTDSLTFLEIGLWLTVALGLMFMLRVMRNSMSRAVEAQSLLNNLSEGIYRSSMDGRLLSANRAMVSLIGFASEREMLNVINDQGKSCYIEKGRVDEFKQIMRRDGFVRDFVSEIRRHATGEVLWVSENARVVLDPSSGEPSFYEGSIRDISESVRKRNAEARLEKIAATTPDGLFQMKRLSDGTSELVYASKAFQDMTGSATSDVGQRNKKGDERSLFSGIDDEDYPEFIKALNESESKLKQLNFTLRFRSAQGSLKWLKMSAMPERGLDGSIDWFGSLTDVTEHKELVQRIERLAYFDALTDLPNRRLLMNRMGEATKRSSRRRRCGGVIFIDLDGFKLINDRYGHDVGDVFITKIARRLEESLRESDTVARLGGDEFVILLDDLSADTVDARSDMVVVAEKIMTNLRRGIELDGVVHRAHCSMGLIVFRGKSVAPDIMLKRADTAMYEAKAHGRNRYVFADGERIESQQKRSGTELAGIVGLRRRKATA